MPSHMLFEYTDFYLYQKTTNKEHTTQLFAAHSCPVLRYKEIPLKQGHDDFFHLIPYLLHTHNLEQQIKDYVLLAIQEDNYNVNDVKKHFVTFDSNLKRIHSFMFNAMVRLTFIRNRFTTIYHSLKSHFKSRKEQEKFVFRLFNPIYDYYIPLIRQEICHDCNLCNKTNTEAIVRGLFLFTLKEDSLFKHTSDDNDSKEKRIVWNYEMFTDYINKHDILGFEYLSEIIHQCYSLMQIPRNIATYHQLHLAFLSANEDYVQWLDSCQIFTNDSILHEQFNKLRKPFYNPHNDPELKKFVFGGTKSQRNEYKTSSLIEDLLYLASILPDNPKNMDATTQQSISEIKKHLDYEIPKDLFNENYKVTKFSHFNQLIALSLNSIFEEQIIIKKCKALECTCYFPSKDLKSQYCMQHQNNGSHIKMCYANQIKNNPEFGKIYQRFYNTLSQRKHRATDNAQKEELENMIRSWKEDVKKFNNEIQNDLTIIFSKDTYINELNSRCRKYGLEEVRFYKTRKPKDTSKTST